MGQFKGLACAIVIVAAALTSGCATIVKGSTQDLTINTDPTGAACDLSRAGVVIGSVNPTPGTVQIKKDKNNIEVKCKKSGYTETSGDIPANFEGWTVGNVLIGGIIGFAVDYGSGALNSYEPELLIKLTPEKFASAEDQTDFYEKWRADVLQNSAKAKIAASKTCVKEQCDEISKRIDKETEQALAGIESNRNLRSKQAGSTTGASSPATAVASASAAPAVQSSIPGNAPIPAPANGTVKAGDRWKYKLTDVRRSAGIVVVEVIEQRGKVVRERITKEGEKSFIAERTVDADFNPSRIQQIVTLPGGFQMTEVSPYAAPNADIHAGQTWRDLSGNYFLQHVGTPQITAEMKVVGKETVRVPAGSFEAWKLEATSVNVWGGTTFHIKFTYWYAPEMARTVKMVTDVQSQVGANGRTQDIYELASFEAGK